MIHSISMRKRLKKRAAILAALAAVGSERETAAVSVETSEKPTLECECYGGRKWIRAAVWNRTKSRCAKLASCGKENCSLV